MPNRPPEYFRLRYERNKRGWTQTHAGNLAKSLGGYHRCMTQAEISLIELGRLLPDEDQLDALGRVFSLSPASVLLKSCLVIDPDAEVGREAVGV